MRNLNKRKRAKDNLKAAKEKKMEIDKKEETRILKTMNMVMDKEAREMVNQLKFPYHQNKPPLIL
jgi:hypothetical protein